MAHRCEVCGKGPSFGIVVCYANYARRRRWNANLLSVRAVVAGARRRVRVCTTCLRSGRITKAS